MKELNFSVAWNIIGLAAEIASLSTDYEEGSTFLAVDTSDVYILYQHKWYKL